MTAWFCPLEPAVWPSLIPQKYGGALLSGGKPGNPGHNQHTDRQKAQAVRGELVTELEGAARDLPLPASGTSPGA